MKISKLAIAKDSSGLVRYDVILEVEDLQTAEDVTKAKIGAEKMIDGWLSSAVHLAPKPQGSPTAPGPVQTGEVPQIDIAEIDALPWLAKNKEKPQPGSWGWVLSDPEKHTKENAATVLKVRAAIQAYNGTVTLGEYDFKLNGDKGQFIHRYPRREERAR